MDIKEDTKWKRVLCKSQRIIKAEKLKKHRPVKEYTYYKWIDPSRPSDGHCYVGMTTDIATRTKTHQRNNDQTKGLEKTVIGISIQPDKKASEKVEQRLIREAIREGRGKEKMRNERIDLLKVFQCVEVRDKRMKWKEN